ncbi:hypothetical protein N7523_001822 [Penicillium sp. IBT 18751x]|nr:hypothetical protein N7523_001822 [Penicillium sp. IBT 18751x]
MSEILELVMRYPTERRRDVLHEGQDVLHEGVEMPMSCATKWKVWKNYKKAMVEYAAGISGEYGWKNSRGASDSAIQIIWTQAAAPV